MKKFFVIMLGLLLVLSVKRVNAEQVTLTYSDWSIMYPSGIDEDFIQSEVRYKWFKFENNKVIYHDEYATSMDGYIKDEGSETTFYRYITNAFLAYNSKNELVMDTNYCSKNFCYIKMYVKPTMVDPTDKTESKYATTDIYNYASEVAPFTGDMMIYSFLGLILSGIVLIVVIKKRRKMSYE